MMQEYRDDHVFGEETEVGATVSDAQGAEIESLAAALEQQILEIVEGKM